MSVESDTVRVNTITAQAVAAKEVTPVSSDFSDEMLAQIAKWIIVPKNPQLKDDQRQKLVKYIRSGAPFDRADIPNVARTLWLATSPEAKDRHLAMADVERALGMYYQIAYKHATDTRPTG